MLMLLLVNQQSNQSPNSCSSKSFIATAPPPPLLRRKNLSPILDLCHLPTTPPEAILDDTVSATPLHSLFSIFSVCLCGKNNGSKAMKISYRNRKNGILKKGKELSTLCDVKVCVIIVSPDGELETWPNNLTDVKALLSAAVKGSSKKGSFSRPIKIPKSSVKGKEIMQDQEVFSAGTSQENNMPNQETVDHGCERYDQMGSSSAHYPNMPNQEHDCGRYDQMGSSSAYYPNMPNQEPCVDDGCGRYDQMGSSSAFFNSSGLLNFPNQDPCVDHGCGRYEMGSSSDLFNSSGLLNFPGTCLDYQQYEEDIGIWEYQYSNLHMLHPNQEPPNLAAYQQDEIGSSSSACF